MFESSDYFGEPEWEFPDLNSPKGYPFRFDWFIVSLGLLIEFDGSQHWNGWGYGDYDDRAKSFGRCNVSDNLKTAYARDNGYSFIRISHRKTKSAAKFVEYAINYLRQNRNNIIFDTTDPDYYDRILNGYFENKDKWIFTTQ
eukprot:29145_1